MYLLEGKLTVCIKKSISNSNGAQVPTSALFDILRETFGDEFEATYTADDWPLEVLYLRGYDQGRRMTVREAQAAFNTNSSMWWPAIFDLQHYNVEMPQRMGLNRR